MVRAVTCKAKVPGFDSSSDQLFILFFSGLRRLEKTDPDWINCVILRIHVASGELAEVQGMGVKKP